MASNSFSPPTLSFFSTDKAMVTFDGHSPLPPYCAPVPQMYCHLKSDSFVFQEELTILCESASLDNSLYVFSKEILKLSFSI